MILLLSLTANAISQERVNFKKELKKEKREFKYNIGKGGYDVGIFPGESPTFQTRLTTEPLSATSWGATLVGGGEYRAKIAAAAKRDVFVYIFDTGEPDHKDLQNTKLFAKSYTGEPTLDLHGHSSHVGGTIAGNPSGGLISPAAGLIDAGKIKVIYAKVLNNSGSGSFTWILSAATEMLEDSKKRIQAGGFCIWNFSLGGGSTGYTPLDNVFTQAKQAGVLVFCATGNSYNRGVNYPGNYKDNIGIAAGKQSGQTIERDSYSTYGAETFFIEPGSQIMSTITGQQYAAWSGTSMATPHACAIAAVVASTNPTWTGAQVLEHMRSKAYDLPPTGRDEFNGWGWHRFVNLLDGNTPTPPPASCDPAKVSQMAVTGITSLQAVFTCNATASGYLWRWRPTGSATWANLETVKGTVTATGLQSNTGYEFQVALKCSTGQSIYSASLTFKTLGSTPVLPVKPETWTANVAIPPSDTYWQNWKTNGQTQNQQLKVRGLSFEVTTNLYGDVVYDLIQSKVSAFFQNSMLIVRDKDDYVTTTGWVAHFLRMHLERELTQYNIKVKVTHITGEDNMARYCEFFNPIMPTGAETDVLLSVDNVQPVRWWYEY